MRKPPEVPIIAVRCRMFDLGPGWHPTRDRWHAEKVFVFDRNASFSLEAVRHFLASNEHAFPVKPDEMRLTVCGTWRSRRRFFDWAGRNARTQRAPRDARDGPLGLVGWVRIYGRLSPPPPRSPDAGEAR